jgi:hypothetical protein
MANPSCCQIIYNSEILLNEFHNNNFIFVLDKIPVSFLLSKFNNSSCLKSLGPSPDDYSKFNNLDAYKEANNDVRNLAMFTSEVNIPGCSIDVESLNLFSSAPVKSTQGPITFDPFRTTIQVDENFFIPRFFYHWLTSAANPEEIMKYTQEEHVKQFYTDGHLLLLDNNRQKTIEIKFEGMHPISISPIDLKSSAADKVFITIDWLYTSYVFADEYKTVYGGV